MSVAAPTLAPLFRSDLQFRLLGYLAAEEGREATLTDLAEVIDASYAAVWAEVDRLLELGVLEERRVGRSKLVRFATAPAYIAPLRKLLLQTYGVLPLLRDALEPLAELVEAFIYGSWARRYVGEAGPPPGDVDVLVVMTSEGDPMAVYRACRDVADETGQTVNATVVTQDEWEADRSAFADEVRGSPRVAVTGDGYGRPR